MCFNFKRKAHRIKEHNTFRKRSEDEQKVSSNNNILLPFVDLTNQRVYKAITLKRTPITSQLVALKNEDSLKNKNSNLSDKNPVISTDKKKI